MTRYSVEDLTAAVDQRAAADQSVVLRYRHALCFADLGADAGRFRDLQEHTSIAEGLRIFALGTYHGVQIDILDETSLMHTRTIKSIDGCVSIAHCLLRDYRSVVFESGGNTGVALTDYAARAGLTTHCFVPAHNLPVLEGGVFEAPDAHLIAVEDPRDVKGSAREFATLHHLPLVPQVGWRFHASMFVGCFLVEQLTGGPGYDYLAQTISAAFGPIGIYRILFEHVARVGRLPRFLGVQQEQNCAMVRAWRAAFGEGAPATTAASTAPLLARVAFDREPHTHGTSDDLHTLLRASGGDLVTVNHSEFERALQCGIGAPDLLRGLAAHGVTIATADGAVLEKTGLLGLAGTLKEIDSGRIVPGARVLVCLTGGTALPQRPAVPDSYIRRPRAPQGGAVGAPST